jgi:hypothetical protein
MTVFEARGLRRVFGTKRNKRLEETAQRGVS